MLSILRSCLGLALTAVLCGSPPSRAATDSDDAALSLSSAPVESAVEGGRRTRLFIEGAIGAGDKRDGSGYRDIRRGSIDFTYIGALAPGWRAVLSDRLDSVKPNDLPGDSTINSLREAYVSWQPEGAKAVVDLGRVNLRYGPAYGFNPTDFFRDGALRTITSLDPIALRENRLGTVVLRGQHLWPAGSVSLAYSPKIESRPSDNGWSLDLGATNNRDRGLLVLSSRLSDRISGQALLYKERGSSAQVGASLTALLSDAIVGYAEWSRGSEISLLDRALGLQGTSTKRNRLAAGVTYTTSGKLSITGEYQYNGFALDPAGLDALRAAPPAAMDAYVLEAVRRQDPASRKAYLLYLTQKGIGLKGLDLTALLRVNGGDHSRLGWLELRHHWSRFDLALRLQQQGGRDASEYGVLRDRRSAQLVASYYF